MLWAFVYLFCLVREFVCATMRPLIRTRHINNVEMAGERKKIIESSNLWPNVSINKFIDGIWHFFPVCAQVINIFRFSVRLGIWADCGFWWMRLLPMQKFSGKNLNELHVLCIVLNVACARERERMSESHFPIQIPSLSSEMCYHLSRLFVRFSLAQSKQFSFVKCLVFVAIIRKNVWLFSCIECAHRQIPGAKALSFSFTLLHTQTQTRVHCRSQHIH